MLLELPECLRRETVGKWLVIKELARLDSAVCAYLFREDLMFTYSSLCVRLTLGKAGLESWILLRNIKVQCVDMSAVAFAWYVNVRELIRRNASSITAINFDWGDHETLRIITDHCRLLNEFRCVRYGVPGTLALLKANRSTLHVLSVRVLKGSDIGDIVDVNLPHLTSLSVSLHEEKHGSAFAEAEGRC